jgi:hypothetical protein
MGILLRGVASAVTVMVVCIGVARADDAPASASVAKQHYEEGTKALNLGEFKRAITEYKAGYNAKPDPVFLYNMGQAARLDGDLVQAAFYYRSYLTNAPHAANRREVESRIASLDAQISRQRAVTEAPPNGAAPPPSFGKTEPPSQPLLTTTEPDNSAPPAPAPAVAPKPVDLPPSVVVTPTVVATTEAQPLYKKWWLWTAVGAVVVVAVGVGVGVGVSSGGNSAPASKYGTQPVF